MAKIVGSMILGHRVSRFISIDIVLLIIASVLIFYNIGEGSLLPSDDCIYAQASREIGKNLLAPTWMGEPMFEKGPVLFWLLALARLFFGDTEAAMRLPGGICAFLSLMVCFRIARTLELSKAATIAALSLLLSSNLFYFNARRPMTDIPAMLFGLLGFWLFSAKRAPLFAGASLGVSALTKLTGPLPAFAAILALRAAGPFQRRSFALFLFGLALVFLPWHVYMAMVFGKDFVSTYFGYHIFRRASEVVVGSMEEPTYLAWLLEREGLVWLFPLVAVPLVVVLAMRRRQAGLACVGFWLGALMPLLFSRTSLPHYLVACIPAATFSVAILSDYAISISRLAGAWVRFFVIACLQILAVLIFFSNNFADLANPDYGGDTKRLCRTLKGEGLTARLEGACDLHDPCLIWYCEQAGIFYALDRGFFEATKRVPVLSHVIRLFDVDAVKSLAARRTLIVTRSDRFDVIKSAVAKWGFGLTVRRSMGSRVAFEIEEGRK